MSKSSSGHFKGTKGEKNSSTLNNKFPTNESKLKHIFREAEGHMPDTPENRKLIEKVANDSTNFAGTDKYGNEWYSEFQPDGSQIWVIVRNGTIQNAGKNDPPRNWDKETGYSNNPKKDGSWRKKE